MSELPDHELHHIWIAGHEELSHAPLESMSDILTTKAPEIQEVVARLMSDLGPDRVAVRNDGGNDRASVTVALRSDPSRFVFISTEGMEAGRYAVSYEKLRTKRGGDATVEQQTSSRVMYGGLHWIARKIFEDGVVTDEFDTLPKERRIRR